MKRLICIVLYIFLLGCQQQAVSPTVEPTLYPTFTPLPTYTPYPTATATTVAPTSPTSIISYTLPTVQLDEIEIDLAADGQRIRGMVSGSYDIEAGIIDIVTVVPPPSLVAATIAAPTVTPWLPVATCDRTRVQRIGAQDIELCIERGGEQLPARTLTREEIGFWWAELDISAEFLPRAYSISQCESGGQWTAFWIDGVGNRMVGPFAINWRFFADPAAHDIGRVLDPFNDRDYMTMVKWLLDRNGWSIWDCDEPTRSHALPTYGFAVSAETPTFTPSPTQIALRPTRIGATVTPAPTQMPTIRPITATPYVEEETSPPTPLLQGEGRSCMSIGSNLWFFAEWGEAALDANGAFSAEYLNSLEPYSVIRYHDWINTNTNREIDWSDRRVVPGYVGVADQGVQWETLFSFANKTGHNVWLTAPTWASDDYFVQLAQLAASMLDPDLHLYLEYSNEVWNTVFDQAAYVADNGGAAFQAQRSAALWDAFSAEFDDSRLHRVIAIRNGDTQRLARLLHALDGQIDVVAVNAYVGDGHVFDEATAADVWARGIDDEIAKFNRTARLLPDGVRMVAYEGGQHWKANSADFAAWEDSAEQYALMLDAFDDYLDLFMHYTHSGVNVANNEQWGARRGVNSADWKYRALRDYCSNP